MISDYRDIISLFVEADRIVNRNIPAYMIGGGAMMKYGIKNQTKDIDIVVRSTEDFTTINDAFFKMGFESLMPEHTYDRLALSQILIRDDYRIDLFNRTVCGKLHLSEGMMSRSKQELFTRGLTLNVCAPEDILIFKSVTEREGDRDDATNIIRSHAIRWDLIVSEIKHQISLGEDVWVTWMAAFFNELAERDVPIGALKEIGLLSDIYFEEFEKKNIDCGK